jgi:flagellar biosynthetic protein FliR
MPLELFGYFVNLPFFFLVFARLAGMIMFQPILGALSVPRMARVVFVLALTGLMMPYAEVPADLPDTLVGLAIGMAQEVALGAILGLVMAIVFIGLQIGGQLIAQEAGLAFGQVADPSTSENMSIISSLYLQFGMMIFLIVGGHRVLMLITLDSLQAVPLMGGQALLFDGGEVVLAALTMSFEYAIRVAAPGVITMFLLNIAMGFVGRTVPQLNIMTLGFSLKGLLTFLVIAVSLPTAAMVFLESLEILLAGVRDWLLFSL